MLIIYNVMVCYTTSITALFYLLFDVCCCSFSHFSSRGQVMSGREWCTLEEWLQCRRPLCPLVVRHDGRVEYPSPTSSSDLSPSSLSNNINNNRPTVGQSTEPPAGIRVCFASRRIGGTFLDDGTSQVKTHTQEIEHVGSESVHISPNTSSDVLYVVVLPFWEAWLSIFVRRRSFVFNSGPGLLLIPNGRRPSIAHVLYRLRQFLSFLPFGTGQHKQPIRKQRYVALQLLDWSPAGLAVVV